MAEVVKFSPEVLRDKHILRVYKAESFFLRSLRRSNPQSHQDLLQKARNRGIDEEGIRVGFVELVSDGKIRLDGTRVSPSPVRASRRTT